jgi:hypothetical protein
MLAPLSRSHTPHRAVVTPRDHTSSVRGNRHRQQLPECPWNVAVGHSAPGAKTRTEPPAVALTIFRHQ